MSAHKKAILALIIANTIWGAASPIFKWSLTNISPMTLAFLRFSLASIILFPFVYHALSIKARDIPLILGSGLFGVGINIPFFFYGLKYAPSINAPMIASSGPVFLIIGSIFFLKEKPRHKVIAGTIISLLGVALIIVRPLLENGFATEGVIGNLFFLIATISGVVHSLIVKRISTSYTPAVITFWTFLVGSLLFLPLFISEIVQVGSGLDKLNFQGATGIIFGVLLSSALAYYLFNYGLQKIAANEVGVFAYIDPVIAVLIAVPLLQESITSLFLLGSLFVFMGIFIAEGRIHYHPLKQLLLIPLLTLMRG